MPQKAADLIDGYSLEDISKRAHTLVGNLKTLSHFIIDCLHGNTGATKVGLTKFSHLVSDNNLYLR